MTSYTLYYLPATCSLAVHAALREVGADFEIKNVAVPDGQPRPSDFLAINPRGNVPVLVCDGHVIREGGAILVWLLDQHSSALLPRQGFERASALEWLMFANSTLHPAYSRVFFLLRQLGDGASINPLFKTALAAVQANWDEVEKQLAKHEYIAGNSITIADILLAVIANWSPRFGEGAITFGAKTRAYLQKVIARPSLQAAMAAEGVTYKVAA